MTETVSHGGCRRLEWGVFPGERLVDGPRIRTSEPCCCPFLGSWVEVFIIFGLVHS